ncbi:hypothetical protein FN976_08335 [Caenimonas sedimenti]|uniref:Uncharacterized protein n=1 Tax=Caenimonas sedimenti TaxID=2596921 RepID=A0A562ZTP7_9BURK|nr:hypothetical protein [Caenimonas sedimenti]TWO71982.1 hypothetical protein FN976_08335 [Caenimonas sedimenti]
MALSTLRAALGACAVAALANPAHGCATSIAQLRALLGDAGFALHWREVSMRDGMPLVVRVSEEEGRLVLRFVKTAAGLWAEGPAEFCLAGEHLEARIARERIRVGPAAPWLLRQSLGGGARFVLARLPQGQLRIGATGWSGVFEAGE